MFMRFAVRVCIVHSLSSGCGMWEGAAATFVEMLEENTTLQSLKFRECFHFRVVCSFTALSNDCFDLLCFQVFLNLTSHQGATEKKKPPLFKG